MPAWLDKLLSRTALAPPSEAVRGQAPRSGEDGPALISRGNALLDQERWGEAEACYRQALQRDPRSTPAAANLGFVLLELARPQEAREALTQALVADPTNADALFMLGRLEMDSGNAPAAVQRLTPLIAAHPDFVPAYPLLGRAHVDSKELALAKAVLEAGVAIDPASADLSHDLGNVQLLLGDTQGAAESYQAALRLDPTRADSRASLGHSLFYLKRLDESRQELLRALADGPPTAESCHMAGAALQALGLLDHAIRAYRLALALDAKHAGSHLNLGIVLQARGQHAEARASFEALTELQPSSAAAWRNLGTAMHELQRLDDAEFCYRRAVTLDPKAPDGHANLAVLAIHRGATTEALKHFETVLSLDPDQLDARSSQLWALSYSAEPTDYVSAAREFGRRLALRAQPYGDWLVEPKERDPRPRKLRLGLVSGDLRAHPVGFFIESVLSALAEHGIEVHAFPTSLLNDDVTARLKPQCVGWTPLVGMHDNVAAERIRAERIHLLVDLAGHTAHNRLRMFAWRPAPVQLSWLGFFASTGVQTMDYVIADAASVPAGQDDQFTETVWRLPHTRLCFTPPAEGAHLSVTPPPALQRGHVTFGCYQNFSKYSDGVLVAWRQIMEALPNARLRIQTKQTGDDGRSQVRTRLASAGIPTDRVQLVAPTHRAGYLASYAEVDLLLDTFPFPGGTTTCEALWMGVPTLTLAGNSMMSNQGKALITCAGLPEWVANSEAEYVEKAVAWASDLEGLRALRARLRDQVLASPLFDGDLFAADLAQALFAMWARGGRPAVRDATSDPSS